MKAGVDTESNYVTASSFKAKFEIIFLFASFWADWFNKPTNVTK